jgi:hypothetical protein
MGLHGLVQRYLYFTWHTDCFESMYWEFLLLPMLQRKFFQTSVSSCPCLYNFLSTWICLVVARGGWCGAVSIRSGCCLLLERAALLHCSHGSRDHPWKYKPVHWKRWSLDVKSSESVYRCHFQHCFRWHRISKFRLLLPLKITKLRTCQCHRNRTQPLLLHLFLRSWHVIF